MTGYETLACFYDLEHETITDDVDMYLNFAHRCGSPVLELGCGTGRVLVPLARAGYAVTGLDNSPAMLARARQRLSAQSPQVRARANLIQADVREFALAQRYTMAVFALNGFMHLLTLEDQLRALRCIRRHLVPGGTFVLDLPHISFSLLIRSDEQVAVHDEHRDPDTGLTIYKWATGSVDQAHQFQHVRFMYDQVQLDGMVKRSAVNFTLRYFFRYEVELLLDKAGFEVEGVYGSYELDAYENACERMLFVARA
ncbi:MAG: class I SAM-dependent methyltransferase [Chloroflexota bacterium]|nr:class I SAM-dependent methyltransferase [Chloroflexota bacterium]